MKQHMRKAVCLLLILTLFCAGCKMQGNSGSENKSPETEKESNTLKVSSTDGVTLSAEEEDYIAQHLEFMKGAQYADIRLKKGGLAAELAKGYQKDHLDFVNGLWKGISKISLAVGTGEVEFENEYEILVGAILQSSAARNAYNTSAELAKVKKFYEFAGYLSKFLKASDPFQKYLADTDQYEKYEEFAGWLDKLLKEWELEQNTNVSKVYGELQEKLSELVPKKAAAALEGFGTGLGYTTKFTEAVTDSISEMMDRYVLLEACSQANKEFLETWDAIYREMNLSDNKETKKVAEALKTYLELLQGSFEEQEKYLMEQGLAKAGKNVMEIGIGEAYDLAEDWINRIPNMVAIRVGLSGGVYLSNFVTNMDDIGYYGKMYLGSGLIAEAAYKVMERYGSDLELEPTLSNAVKFDAAFHILKNTQIASYEYSSQYCQAILDGMVSKLWPYGSEDEVASQNLLLVEKVKWSAIECHKEMGVKNNGGRVVGLGKKVYFWSYSPEAFQDETGFLGWITPKKGVYNSIKERTGNEENTVLLGTGYDQIYIVNGRVYYYSTDGSWRSCDLNGENSKSLKGTILGVSEEYNVVLHQYESKLYALDAKGKDHFLGDSSNILGCYGSYAYFAECKKNTVTVKKAELESFEVSQVARFDVIDQKLRAALAQGNAIFADDGIYVSFGYYSGSGNFFSDAGLYRIHYDTGADVLISGASEYALRYPNIYLEENNGNKKVYFFSQEYYSNLRGSWGRDWMREHVFSYDVNTQKIEEASFTLSAPMTPVLFEDHVSMLLDRSGVYTTIIDKKTVKSLGFPGLGKINDDEYVSTPYIEVIDKYAYVYVRHYKEFGEVLYRGNQQSKLVHYSLCRVDLSNPKSAPAVLFDLKY